MGPTKLANKCSITINKATELMNKFFSAFPKIKQSLDKSAAFGLSKRYIRTLHPFYRIRWFGDLKSSDKVQRESMNAHIQGSAGDMTKLAIYYAWEFIQSNDIPVKIVCTVHDQIDTICHKDYAEQWKVILTEQMEKAAKVIIPNGLLKAETKNSELWQK